ncbi:MAG TPA: sensor histidine kinase [Anaerolineaceae bacterium]|nr:sensor histidine kinase [Anaerolineaceae bacterium]
MTTAQLEKRSLRNSDIAFILVVLAAYTVYITAGGLSDPIVEVVLMAILGLLYLAIGIYGARFVARFRSPAWNAALFISAIATGTAITYLGNGATWLVLVPLVSTAVEDLSRPWALVACLAIFAGQIVPFLILFGGQAALMWGVTSLAAMAFVAAFTQITVSESKARADLAEAHQKLREYAAQVEELSVTRERNRLAREIHDGLGHYLTAINIQIKAAQATAGQDADLSMTALNNAQTLTQEALADVRRSISALRADPSTDEPLPERLNRLLAETESAGIAAHLTLQGVPRPLASQIEFALYRAAQEGLTNVRKHAQAKSAEVELTYRERSVHLQIKDDGSGAVDPGGGFGLLGIKERCELLGGSLRIATAPGKGFTLDIEIPF